MNPFHSAKIIGQNVDSAVYHRQEAKRGAPDFVVSRGELMEFARCPSRWRKGFESDETKSTIWGSLMDCLVLTPLRFTDCYAVAPETYPDSKNGTPKEWNWNATFCKTWREAQGDRTIIKQGLRADAEQALLALWADEAICELLTCSSKQVMVMAEYQDKATGLRIPVKTLIDLVPEPDCRLGRCLGDFKTAVSAAPERWARTVFDCAYDVQAALNLDIYTAATGQDRIDFLHAIQENFHPFETGRRIISAEFLELGRTRYVMALRHYCECLAANHWPGYDEAGILLLEHWKLTEPDPWMVSKWTEWPSLPALKPTTTALAEAPQGLQEVTP